MDDYLEDVLECRRQAEDRYDFEPGEDEIGR